MQPLTDKDFVPERTFSAAVKRIKKTFGGFLHNGIAHPLQGVCYFFGNRELGDWIHDDFIPAPLHHLVTGALTADLYDYREAANFEVPKAVPFDTRNAYLDYRDTMMRQMADQLAEIQALDEVALERDWVNKRWLKNGNKATQMRN